jgi:hypothetical protein
MAAPASWSLSLRRTTTLEHVFDKESWRIYNSRLTGYYHPDHQGCVDWLEALICEDAGEAGYVADQLCERDDGQIVTTRYGVIKLDSHAWMVVSHPAAPVIVDRRRPA